MSRRHPYVWAVSLTAIGLGLFLYKVVLLGFPLTPGTISDIWTVETRVAFVARAEPVRVSMYILRGSQRFIVVSENFISQGYGVNSVPENDNQQGVWSIRKAKGSQTLYYRAVIRRVDTKEPPVRSAPPKAAPAGFEGAYLAAAESLIAEIQAQSADLDGLVGELFKRLNRPQPDENVALLLGGESSMSKKVDIGVRVLRHGRIPARVVHGIRVREYDRDVPLIQWVEAHDGARWRGYDPSTGAAGVPEDYLPWWRGDKPFVELTGANRLQVSMSVSLNEEEAIRAAMDRAKIASPGLLEFSLFSLPIQTQGVYRILLLVPLGAFLLVICRNVVGLKTFGTFMPVLIGLAFRETQLAWGIFLFGVVVSIGLSIRLYLERLKLLLVPRLAAVLFVVVLLMAALSVLTNKLGLQRGLSVALFPMVILTMTIERMSIVWEERGPSEAVQQGIGSLMVACVAYVIMTVDYIEYLVFVFPEMLLVLLAGILLLGRYSGFRLLELPRFKALAERKP